MRLKWESPRSSPTKGSQIFEAVGISKEVIDKYFTGTVSRIGGITLEDIEENVEKLHSEAFDPLGLNTDLTLDSVGATKCAVREKSIAIIQEPFIYSNSLQNAEAMRCLKSIQNW